MKSMTNTLVVLLVLFVLYIPLRGQVAARQPDSASMIASPLVTAHAARDQVRFTALTLAQRMRLEIISRTGGPVYDSNFQPGNLLEWQIKDQYGSGLRDGYYGCFVTVEDLHRQVSHRRGIFQVKDGRVTFADKEERALAASAEEQESLLILQPEAASPFTLVSHNGKEGWIETASGGLNLYAGGASQEQTSLPHFRLTPEGNVGIGVQEPQAKLDVAGVIKAAEGFQFSDGTILKMEGGFAVLVSAISQGAAGGLTSAAGKTGSKTTRVLASSGGIGPALATAGIPRVLGWEGASNTFYGLGAGAITTGLLNSFFGADAGNTNTTGHSNAFFGAAAGGYNMSGFQDCFFGAGAGTFNVDGSYNAFFGSSAGYSNIGGSSNSFFGDFAGYANVSGIKNAFFGAGAGYTSTANFNSFFGSDAGYFNTTGGGNSFFGNLAGNNNSTGANNSIFGVAAGLSNTAGNNNVFMGAFSDGAAGITNATAIGYQAKVTQSNSLVLGSINGVNGATADTNVGIGKTAPASKLDIYDKKSGSLSGALATNNIFSSWNPSSSTDAYVTGQWLDLRSQGSSNFTNTSGLTMQYQAFTGYGTGTIARLNGLRIYLDAYNSNVTGAYGIWLDPISATGAGSVGTRYGIYQAGTGDKNYFAGNVGIGTSNPTERLQVAGNLKVSGSIIYGAPEADIPDYVFASDYKLMPIEELERFIAREKHLPNIPNAGEIREKGLNLSEFQMGLLKKIEELTLYTLEQAKANKEQQTALGRKDAEIAALKSKTANLQGQIDAVSKAKAGQDARLAALEQMMERLRSQEERK